MLLQQGTNSHKSHQIEMERGMLDRKPRPQIFWARTWRENGHLCGQTGHGSHPETRWRELIYQRWDNYVLNDIVYGWLTFKVHVFNVDSSRSLPWWKFHLVWSFLEFPKKSRTAMGVFPITHRVTLPSHCCLGCRTLQRCGRFSRPESWSIVLITNRNRS